MSIDNTAASLAATPGRPMRQMKVVVYTCTFLDYDQIFPPLRPTPDADYVLFSDRRPRSLRGWKWRPLPDAVRSMSQNMANRYCKMFPHRMFPEADISIYIDGNTLVLGDLTPLISEFIASEAGIGLFPHKERDNIFEEFVACQKAGKIKQEEAQLGLEQLARYRAAGLPCEHPFTENGIIFRRHDNSELDAAMDIWWEELCNYTKRDQLSLPYVLHSSKLSAKIWNWNYKYKNPYFIRYPHRRGVMKDFLNYARIKLLTDSYSKYIWYCILYVARFSVGRFARVEHWRGHQNM